MRFDRWFLLGGLFGFVLSYNICCIKKKKKTWVCCFCLVLILVVVFIFRLYRSVGVYQLFLQWFSGVCLLYLY